MLEGFKPGEECAVCQGKCCKEHGCVLAPEDFFKDTSFLEIQQDEYALKEYVLERLKKENLHAIDQSSHGQGTGYYIRMRHKCYTFIGVDALGECIALGEDGCSLSYDDRPKGGRMLKSEPNFSCHQEYGIDEVLEDWKPYRNILESIWNEYEPKFQEDGTFDRCDANYFEWLRNKSGR